jgi:hypothetical protein
MVMTMETAARPSNGLPFTAVAPSSSQCCSSPTQAPLLLVLKTEIERGRLAMGTVVGWWPWYLYCWTVVEVVRLFSM